MIALGERSGFRRRAEQSGTAFDRRKRRSRVSVVRLERRLRRNESPSRAVVESRGSVLPMRRCDQSASGAVICSGTSTEGVHMANASNQEVTGGGEREHPSYVTAALETMERKRAIARTLRDTGRIDDTAWEALCGSVRRLARSAEERCLPHLDPRHPITQCLRGELDDAYSFDAALRRAATLEQRQALVARWRTD